MKKVNIIILFFITLFITANAQTDYKPKLDQYFDRLNEKNKAMGTLVLAKDGNNIYNRSIGFGYISNADKKPLNAETRYRIGSVTKMFTAVMIFQLIEEGKLKLTDHLDQFYPEIPNSKIITIEQILAHRSGIRDVAEDRELRPARFELISRSEMLALIAKGKPDFEPGAKYAYSNAGYIVLANIVEKVSGKSYETLLKKISIKAGLKNTYMGTGKIDANKNESFSYKYSRDWELQPETHMSILFGSGAIISTPGDLAKFIDALFNGKLISEKNLGLMKELMMEKFTYNGKDFYGHTGGVDGFGAWLMYLPEEHLAFSYATNGKVYSVGNMVEDILNIYRNKPFTIPTFESLAIGEETLASYVGVYAFPGAPVKFTISKEGGKLFMQMNSQQLIPLEPVEPNKFKVEAAGMGIEFDTTKKTMTIKRNGGERVLTKEN